MPRVSGVGEAAAGCSRRWHGLVRRPAAGRLGTACVGAGGVWTVLAAIPRGAPLRWTGWCWLACLPYLDLSLLDGG